MSLTVVRADGGFHLTAEIQTPTLRPLPQFIGVLRFRAPNEQERWRLQYRYAVCPKGISW